MLIEFVVEQAGCPSCAELIRDALGEVGDVEQIEIDEAEDIASVRLVVSADVGSADLDRILGAASTRSGHTYGVRPGSLKAASL